jgi:hypothetical protein
VKANRKFIELVVRSIQSHIKVLGWEKKGIIYVLQKDASNSGWLGINRSVHTADGSIIINPVVGFSNAKIEKLTMEFRGVHPKQSPTATFACNIGYICDFKNYYELRYSSEEDLEGHSAELSELLGRFVPPLLVLASHPMEMLRLLKEPRLGDPNEKMYRIPILLRALGRHEEAADFLSETSERFKGTAFASHFDIFRNNVLRAASDLFANNCVE